MTSTADSSTSWTSPEPERKPVSSTTEPEPTQAISAHPLDDPRPAAPEEDYAPVRRGRGLGANRHLLSIVLCLLAVLGAYAAVDYGFYRANVAAQSDLLTGRLPDETMLWLGVGGLCLLIAAFCARISALGPFLVGLVLGVGPAVWVFLDFSSFVDRLDDVPEMWDNTTFGLSYVAFALFPVVGGALLGAAFAGRWRRPRTVTS